MADEALEARGLFGDTSFFYATLDPRDRDHAEARALTEAIERRQIPLITTWEIVVETVTLLRYRLSYQGAMAFLDQVLPTLNVVYVDQEDRGHALDRFRRFSRDKSISLCDAISHRVVRDRLNDVPCLAFDADFERLGLTVIRRLD